MVLVLALGDAHIPERSLEIPSKFKQLLVPGRIQHILITGNIDLQTLDFLKTVSTEITTSAGDYSPGPDFCIKTIGNFKIGVIHGHQIIPYSNPQSLSIIARKYDVDVLITGNTHQFEAFEYQSRFFVNPGSLTGAFTPLHPSSPSFVLMDVLPTSITLYVYQLINGEIKVEKMEFSKKS